VGLLISDVFRWFVASVDLRDDKYNLFILNCHRNISNEIEPQSEVMASYKVVRGQMPTLHFCTTARIQFLVFYHSQLYIYVILQFF
jgi:hypothetical protein